jgi:NTP pyrophosphatase (non-canonical NTP hydrolase)
MPRLDEWYRRVNSAYLDRNFYRTADSVLCHLFEIAGGLSCVASHKQKPSVDPQEHLAKAIGWWLALCGKVGVRSVEGMVWAKFPQTCPYCLTPRHDPNVCRRPDQRIEVNWKELRERGKGKKKPESLTDWMLMFQHIYPRDDSTSSEKSFSRLAEELGELSEAIRVLPINRGYFITEASDVFAWLMGIANQMRVDKWPPGSTGWSEGFVEKAMEKEYPDGCKHCKSKLCKCPAILGSTLGRIAAEGPEYLLSEQEQGGALFSPREALDFFRRGAESFVVNGEEIRITPELINDMTATLKELVNGLTSRLATNTLEQTRLAVAFARLETLASTQELTQKSVDELLEVVRAMPSESRQNVSSILASIAGNIWTPLLLRLIN